MPFFGLSWDLFQVARETLPLGEQNATKMMTTKWASSCQIGWRFSELHMWQGCCWTRISCAPGWCGDTWKSSLRVWSVKEEEKSSNLGVMALRSAGVRKWNRSGILYNYHLNDQFFLPGCLVKDENTYQSGNLGLWCTHSFTMWLCTPYSPVPMV